MATEGSTKGTGARRILWDLPQGAMWAMSRTMPALLLFLLAGAPCSAQSGAADSSRPEGPVRCPLLTEAPAEIHQNPEHFDRIIRYLRLVERYCRDADQALREIDEFPWSDFKGGRGRRRRRRFP